MTTDQGALPSLELGTYRHSKTGHEYDVIGVALDTETNAAMVVYKPLGESEYRLFVRPYDMFVENVRLNGALRPRFEKVHP